MNTLFNYFLKLFRVVTIIIVTCFILRLLVNFIDLNILPFEYSSASPHFPFWIRYLFKKVLYLYNQLEIFLWAFIFMFFNIVEIILYYFFNITLTYKLHLLVDFVALFTDFIILLILLFLLYQLWFWEIKN